MLSENKIQSLIQPLIDRQIQQQDIVLKAIAARLKELNTVSPSDVFTLQQLLKTGNNARNINKKLSKLTKLSENEIKRVIKTVAKDSYADAKPFYDYRHKPYISFEDNTELQRAVKAIERITLQDYTNLSNTTAFMLRDINNPLILHPTKLSLLYDKVIDASVQSIISGFSSYNTIIPKTIKSLINSGIQAVEYTTDKGKKHYVRLDSVVKNNILNAVRQVQQEVQNITGEQFGADGVELSVHEFSAPDHEPVQGHIFTMQEFDKMQLGESCKDINGTVFEGFQRPIGMWNCRHFAWNIIIGHKSPTYTDKELEEMKERNKNGMIIKDRNGKPVQKSMYWCTQKRNTYELDIRRLKEGRAMAEQAEQEDLAQEYNIKLNKKMAQYKSFCKSCGLKTRFENTRIFL